MLLDVAGVAVGVLAPRPVVLRDDRVALQQRVVAVVHVHVQPRTEGVLVGHARNAAAHLVLVLLRLAGDAGGGRDDAGGLNLALDLAVKHELPEESVLVVAHGGDG